MTSLTLITLAIVVYGVIGRLGFGRAIALGGATPVGAALVFGSTALPTFYALAIGAPIGLLLSLLGRTRRDETSIVRIPGLPVLVAFTAWSIGVTLVSPQIFHGIIVLAPGPTETLLTAGPPIQSNIAQMLYLVLGVFVVAFLARSRHTAVTLVGIATGGAMLLSFWSYLHTNVGLPYPEGLFDNSPAFVFQNILPDGQPRFRGIFSEPASLATSSLVTIAYMASRATQTTGLRRLGCLAMIVISAVMSAVSTSATFVVVAVVLAVVALGVILFRVFLRRHRVPPLSAIVAVAVGVAAVWLLPVVAVAVEQVVDSKVSSSSYTQRSGADAYSYELLARTFGLGVGLGANRPSSFLATLLSTTGVVGTVLFAAAIVVVLYSARANAGVRPAAWALVALLIAKVVSSPDLSDPSGVLWISLGVLAHGAVQVRSRRRSPAVALDELPDPIREPRPTRR